MCCKGDQWLAMVCVCVCVCVCVRESEKERDVHEQMKSDYVCVCCGRQR